MKVLTNPLNPIMEQSYRLAFDLTVFDPNSTDPTPPCDVILCQGINALNSWILRMNRDGIKRRIVLTHYEAPYPFSMDHQVLAGIAQHPAVSEVIVLNENQRAMWSNTGKVIYPTLDFDQIPEWTGDAEEKYVFSYIPDGPGVDWSRGFSFATQVGIKPLNSRIHSGSITLNSELFTKCHMYFNTSLLDPVPWGFAIAMAAGAPIVSTQTFFTKKAFSVPGSYYGFLHNSAHALRLTLVDAWNTKDFVEEFKSRGMDKKLRARARDLMNQARFIEQWQQVIGG